MLGLFTAVKDRVKPKFRAHRIDNWVFQLHYQATSVIFFVATILVTSREYIGEHIRCINDMKKDEFTKVIERFCFFTSTFTVIDDNKGNFTFDVPHPGVHPFGINSSQPIRVHFYYQWVPFVLFGQAIMFYLTHLIWKSFEGGRLERILASLDNVRFAVLDKVVIIAGKTIPNKDQASAAIKQIKEAFVQRIIMNKSWAQYFILCEILNVFNVVLQFHIIHVFIGGHFYNLGPAVINDSSVLDTIFPKVTKCTFHKYGPSGTIQNHDTLCILALNIITEKIYVFLWFWLLMLFIASCLILVWRMATLFLYSRSLDLNRFVFGGKSRGKLHIWRVFMVAKHFTYVDWLLLNYLAKNLPSLAFEELFLHLIEDKQEPENLMDLDITQEMEDVSTLLKIH